MSTPELRKQRSQRFSVPTQRPHEPSYPSHALERTLSNESSQSSNQWSYSHSPPPLHSSYQPPQLIHQQQHYQSYPPPLQSPHYSHQQYSSEPNYYPPPQPYSHYPTHELPDDVIPTAIVIKNIPFNVPKEFLLSVMEDLRLPPPFAFNYHFDNNQFRGLAFANFRSPADAALTVSALNGFDLQGRKLRTEFKKVLKEGEKEKIERDKALKRMRSQQDLSSHQHGATNGGGMNGNGGGYGQENGGNDFTNGQNGNGGRVGAGWNRREGSTQSQSSGYGGNSYQSVQQLQHSSIYNSSTAPRLYQYNQPTQPTASYQSHISPQYPISTTNNNNSNHTVGGVGGATGEEDDYGQLLVNGPYSGTFNSFHGALEIGSRPVEDGFELLGSNVEDSEVASAGSSAHAVDPRYELDLNDSRTLEIFSRCLIFKDDSLRDELAFARSLSSTQRTTVHLVAKKLGLQHRSIGIGEERCVVVFKSASAPFPKTLRPATSARGSNSSLLQNPPTSNVAFLTPTTTTTQGIRYKKSMPEIRHHHTSPFADRSGAGWGSHDINSNTSSREGSAEPVGTPSSTQGIGIGGIAGYGGSGRGMGGRRSQVNLREGYATVGTGARRLRENSSVMGLFQTGFYDATPPASSSSSAVKSTTASSTSTNATTPPSTGSTSNGNGAGAAAGAGGDGMAGMLKGMEGLAIRQPKGPEEVGGFTRRTSRAHLRE